jgi:hypothetical protein
MVNAEEWTDKVVKGKKYRITTRWGEEEVEFCMIGAIGSDRQDPVWRSEGKVTSTIPWQAIESITPLDN